MPRSRLTLGIWMPMVYTLVTSQPLLFLASFVLREMPTVRLIVSGKRRRLNSINRGVP
ncbi:hypothetical protein V2J09_008129 [Rumex salicifolius]